MTDVAVIVPAYNEEKSIEEVIKRLKGSIKAKIIVIDDASTYKTSKIAKKNGASVIRHKKNKGKGEALVTGFKEILTNYPKIEYVIIIDADSQYDPEDSPKIVKTLREGNDYVVGARYWKRDVPFRHRFANFLWRKAFNYLFKTNLLDSNCGYIGMNKKAMKIISKGSYGGYIIENVMLSKAVENNLKIKQVPVKVHYPEKRGGITGARFFLGNFIFIIEEGFKYKFGIELKIYQKIVNTRFIFSKGG
ncbi:MAG: glycosyltransferase [Candidatus Aenigmarchaeota archaeon]|nr:glycosyltransferase [Candidatus Aenigmarchaeota archaeon]